jgi:HD-GYP domain-containing protein (c-di-GMP phosphodiesterase class II)
MAAMPHDVGKVVIFDEILKKPTRLNNDERYAMQQHTVMGARIFSERYSEFDEAATSVALNHHKKRDGTGYPGNINALDGMVLAGYENCDGNLRPKEGEELPLFCWIVALANVHDALSSHRAYQERLDESHVLDELMSTSETHFDPQVVDTFFACIDTIRSISERLPDN